MTQLERWRSLRFAALIAITLALIAAPASAGKPSRTVLGPPTEPYVSNAGTGCSFAVLWGPTADTRRSFEARRTLFQFDDGRTVWIVNADPTLTNLSTGKSFVHRARYHLSETYDPTTNELALVTEGSVLVEFWPGDQGPDGIVSDPGLLLRLTGRTEITLDVDTFAYTSFYSSGAVTDVCVVLSE